MDPKNYKRMIKFVVPLAILFLLIPRITLFFVICGLIDVSRHKRWDADLLLKYFAGNGLLTWLLSPLNIVFDLLSDSKPYRLTLDDFPEEERQEIAQMLQTFDEKRDEIVADLRERVGDKKRAMLFYKWYDDPIDTSVPEFSDPHKYIKTIGVSVFNSKEKTSLHFGPLRLTIRLLYNLTPRQSENIYIEVNGEKHFWHDDPLFIFDDTIQHCSVNEEEGERMVVFVDVLRPSRHTAFQNKAIKVFNWVFNRVNRMFYKNWDMLSEKKPGKA